MGRTGLVVVGRFIGRVARGVAGGTTVLGGAVRVVRGESLGLRPGPAEEVLVDPAC